MVPRKLSKTEAIALIGLCVVASLLSLALLDDDRPSTSIPGGFRRVLKAENPGRNRRYSRRRRRRRRATQVVSSSGQDDGPAVATDTYEWAQSHLLPLSHTPDPSNEIPIFWHIPKSGGTTAEDIYQCLGQTISNRVGSLPQFGHDREDQLVAFQPWEKWGNIATYVNTDTTGKSGILKAEQMGLVPSGIPDVIFTSDPRFAVEHLYDKEHKGRVLSLFRHPVERLVSKFYYLQVATWERTYNPNWTRLSVLEWAGRNNDNNNMVKKLAGKRMNEWVGEEHLQLAMRTIEETFVVGLMDQMEESIQRFNVVMGIDETTQRNEECMNRFFGEEIDKKNSNPHPKLEEDDPAWAAIAEKNDLDIRLYDHILKIFEEQKFVIDSYKNSMATRQQ